MVSTELNEHLPASDFLFLQYPKQKQKEVRYDKKINTLIVVQFIFLESVNRLWSCKWEMLSFIPSLIRNVATQCASKQLWGSKEQFSLHGMLCSVFQHNTMSPQKFRRCFLSTCSETEGSKMFRDFIKSSRIWCNLDVNPGLVLVSRINPFSPAVQHGV
mgnify:CR=1 FL=1